MNENYVSGIQEDKIMTLSLNIDEYALKLNEKFEQLTLLVNSLKPAFDSEVGKVFEGKYNQLANNYKTVIKNISSYSDDLKKVKSSYKTFEIKTSESFGKDRIFNDIEYPNNTIIIGGKNG